MNLSESQREIAEVGAGVYAVFAGAGSGKTAILTHRVKKLLELGVSDSKIIVCTFTRKAAEEIRERIGEPGVMCDTMHAICLQWIRREPELAGFPYGIKSVMSEREVEVATALRKNIDSTLAEFQVIGFDDIIRLGTKIIVDSPESVIEPGSHLIVDEAQDNSREQWDLIRAARDSGLCDSIMVVGDFRQSIYQWRNASPEDGIAFCSEATPLHQFKNYRSGSQIVDLANKVAALGGFEDAMEPHAPNGPGTVEFVKCPYPEANIAAKMDELMHSLVDYSEIAILCRYNREADAVCAYIEGEGFPVSRPKASDKESIERMCAWANFCANPHNHIALSAFVSLPVRELHREAERSRSSLAEVIRMRSGDSREYHNINQATQVFSPVHYERQAKHAWFKVIGGDRATWESVIEPAIGEPLYQLSESINVNAKSVDIDHRGIAVLTGHSSKGLQWPYVFVLGAYQRQIPGVKKGWRKEEERRLLYVEITRAQKFLRLVIPETERWSEFVADEHDRPLL